MVTQSLLPCTKLMLLTTFFKLKSTFSEFLSSERQKVDLKLSVENEIKDTVKAVVYNLYHNYCSKLGFGLQL